MSNRNLSAFPPRKQRGVIMIFVVIAMTSLIAMVGLALDFGVAFLTQSRIQNALDAAALSGAKTLKVTAGNTTQATTDARAAFTNYLSQLGLLSNASATTLVPDVQFSNELNPFTPSTSFTATAPAYFIRVLIPNGYSIPTYLTRVVPSVGNTLSMGGTAVAGPVRVTPEDKVCGLIPLVVSVGTGADKGSNCSDNNACFGYTVGQQFPLKAGKDTLTAGDGNFNLLTLGAPGGSELATNLAGGYKECLILNNPTVPAKTGETKGPFEGIDRRFGEKAPSINKNEEPSYPPDIYTKPVTNYAEYKSIISNPTFVPEAGGVPGRRLVSVVFSTFDPPINGNSGEIPLTGIGCFFLLAPSTKDSGDQRIQAEFVRDCNIGDGNLSDADLENLGEFYKIVLYKDPTGRSS